MNTIQVWWFVDSSKYLTVWIKYFALMAILIKYSYRFVCFKCQNVKVEEIELSVNNQSKQITITTYPKMSDVYGG